MYYLDSPIHLLYPKIEKIIYRQFTIAVWQLIQLAVQYFVKF